MTKKTHPDPFTEDDRRFMARALELAAKGRGMVSPNPMVGAIYVRDGKILGEGYHRKHGHGHAETEAFQAAGGDVAGATLYVTLEPCNHQGRTPPCTPMLIQQKVARVVVPHADPNPLMAGGSFKVLRKAGIRVDDGLMEAEARRLNEAFLTFHELRRPFMVLKWAMTMDGRIAAITGQSRWISNELSRNYVHELRSNVDAVMVGIGTILQDNPMLNVRLDHYDKRQPKRIIVDGNLRIPARAKVLTASAPGDCIIATSDFAPAHKVNRLREEGHHVLVMRGRRGLIDLRQLITNLMDFEIQSVLCEGGATMHGSLIGAGLVDKVIAFVAPKIVGGEDDKSPITGWGVQTMQQALTLQNTTIRHFEDDVCIEGYVSDDFRIAGSNGPAKPAPRRRPTAIC
jgi:diaminohydroxyphosphoribosylaminopyrimidine deaminase/5-amino-6-(5-phosphoribosylamino)uracil reductase